MWEKAQRNTDCSGFPFRRILTELPPELPSAWSSVFCSTAISASKIFSTGISSFTALVDSTSPSRSLFLCRSSWTAAGWGIGVDRREHRRKQWRTRKERKEGRLGIAERSKCGCEGWVKWQKQERSKCKWMDGNREANGWADRQWWITYNN